MKKLLLSITALSICLSAVSQNVSQQQPFPLSHSYPSQHRVPALSGDEAPLVNINQSTAAVKKSSSMPPLCIIAQTTYDLQSNGSSDNRIYSKSVGVGGTCTMGLDYTLAAPDRGTGYNFASTGACGGFGPLPTGKVETDRRGWPAIDYSETGGFEAFVSHASGVANGIKLCKRSPAGTGAWVESQVPSALDDTTIQFLWPRMRIGGTNGITIHEIDLSLPVANAGVIYHSMDGALTYSRSQDGGVTWDIRHMLLPDVDVAHFSGMGGDGYSIDASGNNVAITYGAFDGDWCVWKSTDNGTTWTRTVIRAFPIPGFDGSIVGNSTDIDSDGIVDTIPCTDGFNAIVIDNNGLVHCFAGDMLMLDDGLDANLSYFPTVDGILYWNENMGPTPATIPAIAFSPDINGDLQLTFAADLGGGYQSGLTTMPSAGVDGNNNLYLAYTTLIENTTNGGTPEQSYRNIFAIASYDGGANWTIPYNITNDNFTEAVFPSVARNVTSLTCLPLLWQQDAEPGLAVRIDLDPFVLNDIAFDCIDVSNFILGVNSIPAPASMMSIYPNPASDYVKLNYTLEKSSLVNISITNVLGQSVYQNETKMVSGANSLNVDLKNFNAGVYFVNTTVGEKTYTSKFVVE